MTTLERIAYWTELIDRWEAIGGSRKIFCEEQGIGYASFLSWCKRLRPDGTTMEHSDTPRCVEVTERVDQEPEDERVMIESASFTITGAEAQITVRGRMTVGSLRRIVSACGTTDVSL